MDFRIGSLLFTSKFDSGNLTRVEKVTRDEDDDNMGRLMMGGEPRSDYEFNVWTRPDCAGTEYENGNRSWFYFGVKGGVPGRLLKINIQNMNKQGKLYGQGFAPIVKTVPGKPKWERIRDKVTFEVVDTQFILSFVHRFADFRGSTTYFAFCYPWSYAECQDRLGELDVRFEKCWKLSSKSPPESIYYHRELMCYSQEKLRIDLITISSCHGICDEEEPKFDPKLFPDTQAKRCKKFSGKRVYVLTSRVHPGETPASHVFNGFLDFILRENDARAVRLRQLYVFKMIPILNPDGVMMGHYRTDTRGVNLNRVYLDPDFRYYPSIYAAKALLAYHHVHNRVIKPATPPPDPTGASQENEASANFEGANTRDQRVIRSNSLQQPRYKNQNQRVQGPGQRYPARNRTINIVHRDNIDNKAVKTNQGDSCSSSEQAKNGVHVFTENAKRHPDAVICASAMSSACSVDKASEVISHGVPVGGNAEMVEEELLPIFQTIDIGLEKDLRLDINQGDYEEEMAEIGPEQAHSFYNVANDVNSMLGNFQDDDPELDAITDNLGNEGSDDDDGGFVPKMDGIPKAPHLADPKFLEIPPNESGIAFYVDLHGHASKRGCFIYGNYHENEETMIDCMLFPKLIAMNTAHFDFTGCNFSLKNMYTKDKRDGMTKEGSGRVAIFKAIGITHSYTLECNYNTGRMVNSVPPASGDDGRATPPPLAGFPPKYTMAHYEDVGKALAVAALDITETNPWCRIVNSEYNHLHGVREWVRRYIRSWKGGPRGIRQMPRMPVVTNKQTSAQSGQSTSSVSGNSTATTRGSSNRFAFGSSSDSSSSNSNPNAYRNTSVYRRPPAAPPVRKELGPIKDVSHKSVPTVGPSNASTRAQRRMTLPACGNNSSVNNHQQRQSKTPPPGQIPLTPENKQKLTSSEFKLPLRLATATDFKSLGEAVSDYKFTRTYLHQEKSILSKDAADKTFSMTHIRNTSSSPADVGTLVTEEEKVQQLKNLSGKRKPPKRLDGAKPIEPPKSDPPKRRVLKLKNQRRSSSHSPKSAKDELKTLMNSVGVTRLKLSPRPTGTTVPEIHSSNPRSSSPIGRLRLSTTNENTSSSDLISTELIDLHSNAPPGSRALKSNIYWVDL
ncbi:cytosolic carboxypeptidase-like protein 5 isoform X2 [Lineus longissimus]|uniref:cytosolic carboxypeptidase-like protein 5 isoform X2 n=1 Tax=Lineus longissimus TaxID=88925 RepID=UPI00315D8CD7